MFQNFVTWKRDGNIIQQHIIADIQSMDVPDARNYGAQSPTDAFWIYINFVYDIKKGDVLVDEANIDDTYRIIARPIKYDAHMEIPAELIEGI